MTDGEQQGQEQQDDFATLDEDLSAAVESFKVWKRDLYNDLQDPDGSVEDDGPEVREALRSIPHDEYKKIADRLDKRDAVEKEKREKAEQEERARSDEGLREQLAKELEQEKVEQAEVERRERIKAELREQREREAAGTTGPDPADVAAARMVEIADALSNRDLSDADRVNLHAEAETVEAVIEKASKPDKVSFDIDEFERTWA